MSRGLSTVVVWWAELICSLDRGKEGNSDDRFVL